MYEIDFLKVGTEEKSGDAITLRFWYDYRWVVVIVDGGFTDVGFELVDHVKGWYDTSHVDLVISTHPDADPGQHRSATMTGQARRSEVIMEVDTHMILETVPVSVPDTPQHPLTR